MNKADEKVTPLPATRGAYSGLRPWWGCHLYESTVPRQTLELLCDLQ